MSTFRGYVEEFSNGLIRGWALNINAPSNPVIIHLLVDQQEVAQFPCDQPRPDVSKALNLTTDIVGFKFNLPAFCFDNQPHQIGLRFPDRSVLAFPINHQANQFCETIIFPGKAKSEYRSFIDGVFNNMLRGWVTKRSTPYEKWGGNLIVSATVDGMSLATARANHYRGDVAESLKSEPNCGFEIPLPVSLRDHKLHHFDVKIVPENIPLRNSPFKTSLVSDDLEARLVELEATIGNLHRQLTTLRRNVKDLIPKRPPNLTQYDEWARAYQRALRERTEHLRLANPLSRQPLISVICPVWKPQLTDFRAAIDSVLHQTYSNWELILVEDGSDHAEIHALMRTYSQQDKRIKSFFLEQNSGIAEATNKAISYAKGAYIAFFDHDDLLSPVALEIMLRAALTTQAKLLYSDEDKIDPAGYFLEPNLKPDFNYRYLLGCNYICHLTMVESQTLRKVGPLLKIYDGAQDHDLILRLVEHLPEDAIFHVKEILYHWRKAENSTAATLTNKNYAIMAGVNCVQDHLKRQNMKGKVSSIDKLSIYKIDWTSRAQPSVTVIIPFRDEVDVTRRCVDTLLEQQNYRNMRLMLVDNFSVQEETLSYLENIKNDPRVDVIRLEEKFNFSRLNNIAAAQSFSDYLLFLNNDVFVHQKDFIKKLVLEAVSFPKVAIVGARLLYPNGTIQHAGVAVGPDIIGAHMHRGKPGNDYGYIGRIRLSHEVTAVTGAAMLIKRDLFQQVGGFDEIGLPVAYNDVDLCLKIRQKGWHILYCAEAVAEHYESLSRKSDDRPEHEERFFHEMEQIKERWRGVPLFENDPSYPRYFREDGETFFDLRTLETIM
ncbi:glycosyltransferase [Aristophania vespae]|uniref:Glycosyltransferase n=2 Tax=Aristophania vespae TaxID=2697033 RepID=A0A6P1NIG7_9PROT|nr:glycosyltransferase [Aristophania vespae]